MSSGLFYHNSGPISCQKQGVWLVFITTVLRFIEIPVVNANDVDPDQMPDSATSDLGLHCLQITLLVLSRVKLANPIIPIFSSPVQMYRKSYCTNPGIGVVRHADALL